MRLIALRGATTVDANEAEPILHATEELMRELLERNRLDADSIVSCIFTLTDDLDAEFPAVAARRHVAEPQRAEGDPLERLDAVPDRLAHPPHLALAALVDGDLELAGGNLADLGG